MPFNDKLVGASVALAELEQEIEATASSGAKVLITGESGVGKEIVARLIHERSRRPGRFLTVNCAGVPDSLLESELFGHVRGSFTGAHRDNPGRLAHAECGTLFLDEVGEMSLRMQSLLLRFLENGEIQRVGSDRVQTADDVRVVAATNRNLTELVSEKLFREDLYYRLNVIHLMIPPLRQRREDILPLVGHFLDVFSASYQVPRPVLAEHTLATLTAYPWPGNVRELRNLIERLVVRSRAGLASLANLPPGMALGASCAPTAKPVSDSRPTQLYEQMVLSGESFWTAVYEPFVSHDLTRDDLRALLARGLQQTRGNYKALLTLFNLPLTDYKRLLHFLNKYKCQPAAHRFRTVPVPPAPSGKAVGAIWSPTGTD